MDITVSDPDHQNQTDELEKRKKTVNALYRIAMQKFDHKPKHRIQNKIYLLKTRTASHCCEKI